MLQNQPEERTAENVTTAPRQNVMISMGETLLLAGLQEQALEVLAKGLPEWVPTEQRASHARLLASQMLVRAGLWKEAEALHAEAVRAIDPQRLNAERLAAELDILRTEGKLLSHVSAAGLEQAPQAAQECCADIHHWEAVRFQASEALLKGEWQAAQALVRDWIKSPAGRTPEGLDAQTYIELLLNSCSSTDRRLPLLWLIESRSLPRSGHHFLKSLLKQAWGEDFSYCEGYQEPGCCKASPCSVAAYWHFAREHRRPHLRLLKSHDFALSDATFDPPPGMLRLIQVRRPFDMLVSWLELEQLTQNREILKGSSIVLERIFLYHEPEVLEEAWRLVDQAGTVMTTNQVQAWLADKVGYVLGFLRKWLPLTRPLADGSLFLDGNVLMRYEDLGQCQQLLQALGRNDLKAEQLPAFAPRHQQVMKRRATRVTELIQANRELLLQADTQVMAAVPAMQQLYPQQISP
jgi:hypothetical protein